MLTKDFTVKTANHAFYEAFKISETATENVLLYEIDNGQWNIPELKKLLEDVLPFNNIIKDYEVTHSFPHLGTRILLLNAKQLYNVVKDSQFILLSIEDVTLKKELETQKDEFIALASHELKSPLTSIKAYSEFIAREMESYTELPLHAPVKRMNKLINRLNQMIDFLLDISKIQSAGLALKKTRFSLNRLIRENIEEVIEHNDKNHVIQLHANAEVYITADAFTLGQVIRNLLSNAIKYSPANTKVIIEMEENKTNGLVTVTVTDKGMGIPVEERNKLFNRFSRASNAVQSKLPGIGLGLYLIKEIIKAHKGKIWLTSKQGEGSSFSFTLPVSEAG